MRTGVRLGVDAGRARVGIAISDPHGMLATPVETVPRATDGTADLDRIAELCEQADALEIIVGLPLALSGNHTASTADAIDFARGIAARLPRVPVRLVDERLSTVSAHSALRASGKKQKGTRSIIDQVAAVIILQHALDAERASGTPPGSLIPSSEER